MIGSQGGSGDIDTRFAHLLQPIRDLAKNWEVDIASQLEEYLDEIDKIAITFDDGGTTMNFAEAALLIQGSACVYSRKVEYLYTMVYQVLDLLASKKKQTPSSVDKDGNDQDANFGHQEEDEFLTLDDIKEHKNIDMKNDVEINEHAVATLPRTPMSLMVIDEGEKGDFPLLSKKGEVLGSRKDFKMNTCNIHVTGTLLLDLSHLNLLESSFLKLPCSTPYLPRAMEKMMIPYATIAYPQDSDDCYTPDIDDFMQPQLGDADMDDFPPIEDNFDEVEEPEPEQRYSHPRPERNCRRRSVNNAIQHKKDLFIAIDPHTNNAVSQKPYRKSRTFKLPTRLKVGENKKRKRVKQIEPPKLCPIAQFCTTAFHSGSSKFSSNLLKVPTFPEFEHLYWLEFQRRRKLLQKERKMIMMQGRYDEVEEDIAQEIEENDAVVDFGPDIDNDDDDGDMEPLNFEPAYDETIIAAAVSESFGGQPMITPSQETEKNIVSSYEELVRYYVDGYLNSAQNFAHISDLAKRVTEWEDNIRPILDEEERRPGFDIHTYGTRVIDKFGVNKNLNDSQIPKNAKISFSKVVDSLPAYEVCRTFLATLQLANCYNVEISTNENRIDTMCVRLLSRRRHFEELQEYVAPSIDT